ncbi:hypothetical protein BJX66DRAFT_280271 [Aspergillus keveii]|uniref:Zn(2)-C6 fungal-type domain-containing protein n=1 Tax=Aspergillus keveii TaxID=714993 RepID=A0ABR4FWT6_9EURO
MRRAGPRVTSACRNCKQRRAKCDGARPMCSRCEQLSRECVYDGVDHRKSRHTHAEFKALHNRILYLEEQLRLLSGTQPRKNDMNNVPNSAPQTLATGNDYDWSPIFDVEGTLEVFPCDNLDLGDG